MSSSSENRKTIHTALINTVANGISLIVGMVMVPVIARVFLTSELGVATTFISTRNIVVVVVMLAIYSFVYKAMIVYKNNIYDYLLSAILFCLFSDVVAFVVALPFKKELINLLSLDNFLFYWLFISIFVFAVGNIANYYCLFFNRSIKVGIIVLLIGPVSQIVSVVLGSYLDNNKYIGRVIGLDISYLIVSIAFLAFILAKGHSFKLEYIKTSLAHTVPIIPHLLAQMVLTQCDLLMISYFVGSDKSGIYSMGHTIGYLAYTVMAQILASWSPWVYRRLAERQYNEIKRNSSLMIIFASYISFGLLTIYPELVSIFLTKAYTSCVYVIPPLVMAMYFQITYTFLYDLEFFVKKTKVVAIASVVAAGLNVALNFIFIPRFGFVAASYTTLTSYFVLFVINYAFCIKINVRNIYDMKSMIFGILIVGTWGFITLGLLHNIVVRYVVLCLVSAIIIKTQFQKAKIAWSVIRGKE